MQQILREVSTVKKSDQTHSQSPFACTTSSIWFICVFNIWHKLVVPDWVFTLSFTLAWDLTLAVLVHSGRWRVNCKCTVLHVHCGNSAYGWTQIWEPVASAKHSSSSFKCGELETPVLLAVKWLAHVVGFSSWLHSVTRFNDLRLICLRKFLCCLSFSP